MHIYISHNRRDTHTHTHIHTLINRLSEQRVKWHDINLLQKPSEKRGKKRKKNHQKTGRVISLASDQPNLGFSTASLPTLEMLEELFCIYWKVSTTLWATCSMRSSSSTSRVWSDPDASGPEPRVETLDRTLPISTSTLGAFVCTLQLEKASEVKQSDDRER